MITVIVSFEHIIWYIVMLDFDYFVFSMRLRNFQIIDFH